MKQSRVAAVVFMVLFMAVLLGGCSSRSFTTEKALVDMAKQYTDLMAAKDYQKVLPMLTGDQLTAMQNILPTLVGMASNVELQNENWEGKCDFMNRDKTRGSVTATYVQHQTVKNVGTLTQRFSTVYDFVKIGDQWKIYSIKVMNQETVK